MVDGKRIDLEFEVLARRLVELGVPVRAMKITIDAAAGHSLIWTKGAQPWVEELEQRLGIKTQRVKILEG